MATYVKTLQNKNGDIIAPRTTVSAVYLEDMETTIEDAIDLKAPINDPTFTGTVSGITKSMVGLGNVDNTSDVNKPISTATQTALNGKLSLTGGTLTGAITATRIVSTGTSNTFITGSFEARGDGIPNTIYPTIGFHQPMHFASVINSTGDGLINIYQGDGITLGELNLANIKKNGVSLTSSYTATIPWTSWTGSSAPYSKTVGLSGILETDTPIIDIVQTGTYATDQTMISNWGNIYRAVTSFNAITFYATAIPSTDIPIQVKVVR